MAFRRLTESPGYFIDGGKEISEAVYEHPVLLVYDGEFESMDGKVIVNPDHVDLLAKNHNAILSKVARMASGEIPMRDCPPMQLDHSVKSSDTIGRLVGEVSSRDFEHARLGKRRGLFGTARFLGKENVEKAKDGRYTHVSIGADFELGKLNELSVTPFPAAEQASLLSKPGTEKGEHAMHEKLKKHYMEHGKLSEADADKKSKDCLKHHMSKLDMDEKTAMSHMEKADDKELSRMSNEYAEYEKKILEPDHEARMAAKAKFVTLAKGMKDGRDKIRLGLRESMVSTRLARLREQAKVTPAELKKLDIKKLSALADDAMEAALSTFEAREPVLNFGSSVGTAKAEAIETITKKYRLARLELESRMNMPMKRTEALKRLKQIEDEEKTELSGVETKVEPPSKGTLTAFSYDDACRMLSEGKHEDLKLKLKEVFDQRMASGDGPHAEGEEQRMSSLAKDYTALQNQFDELVSLVSPVLSIQAEELK